MTEHQFTVSRAKDARFEGGGLRDAFVYRDLAIHEATGGQFGAHVVRAVKRHFTCARLDSTRHAQLFDAWVGGGPGLATCVLDADGELIAVHRGSATPEEVLEFLARARERAEQPTER